MNRFFSWLLRRDETVKMLNDALTEVHIENLKNMNRIAVIRDRLEIFTKHDVTTEFIQNEITRLIQEIDAEH